MANHTLTARRKFAKESLRTAAQAIGQPTKNMAIFILSHGQWSMLDAILHILNQTPKPASLSVWTWKSAEHDLETITNLHRHGDLTDALLIIDRAAREMPGHTKLLQQWLAYFGPGSVRLAVTHAKMATIADAAGGKYFLRGSMNLNYNPRYEQLDITEGCPGFDLVKRVETSLPIMELDSPNRDLYMAFHRPYSALPNLKPWQPNP